MATAFDAYGRLMQHILSTILDAQKKNGKFLLCSYLLTKVFKFFKIKLGKGESRGDKCVYDKENSTS